MNRAGQPQRPPSITPNPALGAAFRTQFPNYGPPPRSVSVLQGGYLPQPGTPRTVQQQQQQQQHSQQTQQPQPLTPSAQGFLGQRTQGGAFTFAGVQHPQTPQQQAPSNGTLHLAPSSEVGLDPNDFPALGSTPSGTTGAAGGSGTGASATTSYATQAGTGVPLGSVAAAATVAATAGGAGTTPGNQPREFTPDDFPALGGQPSTQTQGQTPAATHPQPSQENHAHPPGLNGFPHDQHRQNLLGALSGTPGMTPGMLNLAPTQARSVHPGFQQSDAEKQQQRNNYALKLNQATHAAWNSPPGAQSTGVGLGLGSGAFASSTTNGVLHAPPGVPPPSASYPPPGTIANAANAPTPYGSNGDLHLALHPTSHIQHPQTPAQQVLISAADRWGLLGLLAMIKNAGAEPDQGLSSVGTDLGTMGLDMDYSGNLYSTFITPWADQSAAHTVEPDFHLPACYNVQPPPPGPNKATAFSDETLFFMFYSSPRDALQEVAAQELWNRNWRYHKDLRLWITKESGTSPSQKVPGGEQGQYTFWDAENWVKERKEMTVLYADLEEKNTPAFVPGPGLVLAQPPVQAAQAQTGVAQRGFQLAMAL